MSGDIINCTGGYTTPYNPDAVFYDNGTGKLYSLSGSTFMEINQQLSIPIEMLEFIIENETKIREMLHDWEKDKYPEKFL